MANLRESDLGETERTSSATESTSSDATAQTGRAGNSSSESHRGAPTRKESAARRVNGIVSAAIVAFFLAHATLGSISAFTGFKSPLAVLVWAGIALVGVHVIASIVTSREQLGDTQRPPSPRKKRHLALKWATGGLLAAAVVAHIATMRLFGAATMQSSATGALLTVVLATTLAVHLCVGSKSLLKDLNVDRRFKTAFRIAVIAFAVFFALAAIVSAI